MNFIDRKVIYLLGCPGSRGVIIYIVKITTTIDIYYIGIFYIFVATKFIFSNFLESHEYKPVFLKPIHALIYLAFAFYAMRGYVDYAWKILLVDLLFGVVIHSFYNILPLLKKSLVCLYNSDNEVVLDVQI
jgi:hypothetical protein